MIKKLAERVKEIAKRHKDNPLRPAHIRGPLNKWYQPPKN